MLDTDQNIIKELYEKEGITYCVSTFKTIDIKINLMLFRNGSTKLKYL